MRECRDGAKVHRPPLFDACDLFDVFAASGVMAFLARKDGLCETLLYDILATSTAISELACADGRRFDLVAARDWLAALAG